MGQGVNKFGYFCTPRIRAAEIAAALPGINMIE
jgi:hypothetical protein